MSFELIPLQEISPESGGTNPARTSRMGDGSSCSPGTSATTSPPAMSKDASRTSAFPPTDTERFRAERGCPPPRAPAPFSDAKGHHEVDHEAQGQGADHAARGLLGHLRGRDLDPEAVMARHERD